MGEVIVSMKDIVKTFPGVKALDHVNFELRSGEVMALLGENGAGKSTLMKILSGVYTKDSGTMTIFGTEYDNLTPKQAQAVGVAIIHQELNMCRHLSVAENMFLGREKVNGIVLNDREMEAEAAKILGDLKIDIDPRQTVGDLPVSKQQMVEIAKALSIHAKILIMDEPTSSLTAKEIEELFRIIRQLKADGCGIVYISHRLEEIMDICDSVTVLKDGTYVDTKPIGEVTKDSLIRMMVGREMSDIYNIKRQEPGEEVLRVEDFSDSSHFKDINFSVHKGEILGFAGLVGAGRTEVAKCMIGAYRKDGGTVTYKGETLSNSLSRNIEKGIVYLSEDRKDEGLVLMHSVMDNIALPNLKQLAKPFIRKKEMADRAKDYIKSLRIKTHTHLTEAKNLSGGNQQKVVIAKWLYSNADVYIFDEPTRGIDVGARDEIYNIMYDLVNQGASIIMISSDLVEVLKMCDRVAVMREGVLEAILDNSPDLTQETILKYAMQGGI